MDNSTECTRLGQALLVVGVGLLCVLFAPLGVIAAIYVAVRYRHENRALAVIVLAFPAVITLVITLLAISIFLPGGHGGWVGPPVPVR